MLYILIPQIKNMVVSAICLTFIGCHSLSKKDNKSAKLKNESVLSLFIYIKDLGPLIFL